MTMLPKGVDPIFPNKRLVGYDYVGRPVYDYAATGFQVPASPSASWQSQGDTEVLYEDGKYWIDRAAYERHKEEQRGKDE